MKKGLITQERNKNNNREYYLHLTSKGVEIYYAHEEFDRKCLTRTYESLKDFSDEELQTYIAIQKHLNEVFAKDVNEHDALNSSSKNQIQPLNAKPYIQIFSLAHPFLPVLQHLYHK